MDELDNAVKIDFNMNLKSKGLNKLVKYLFKQIPDKPKQQLYGQRLRDCLRVAIINLYSTDQYIRYSRSDHSSDYNLKKYSAKNIRRITDFLEQQGLIENKLGYFSDNPDHRKTSRMRCTNKLIEFFDNYGVGQEDTNIATKSNLIILRDKFKIPVPFKDNEFTLVAKEKLNNVNQILSHHSIVSGNGRPIHRKAMHRVFNIDFQHGGRFYGDEWQTLNENERAQLKTDNSPVIELDFQALHPTMLYALYDEQLDEDPYSLNGYSPNIRDFLKIVMLVLINTGDRERARKTIQGMINRKELIMPSEISDLKTLIQDFMNKHEAISNLFNAETGLKLQRHDSDICESILTYFSNQEIPVLGVHDSYIVGIKYKEKLRNAMKEFFYNKFNTICHISQKGQKKT